MSKIAQILENNGFKYHKHPKLDSLIVEDLEIVNFGPMIEYIEVTCNRFTEIFRIHIKFKDRVQKNQILD